MESTAIDTVSVLGAGSMGHGIAQVTAMAGYDVTLRDVEQEYVNRGYEQIEWSLEKLVESGRIEKTTAKETLDRIEPVVEMDAAVADADIVIEAVPERIEIKEAVYADLEEHALDEGIFASNTSSLSITELATNTERPSQVCGLHFFNPPVRMELVEVIMGEATNEETREAAIEFVESIEKTPVLVSKDEPGFVVNRILVPLLSEAAWLAHEGVSTIREVDASATEELGLPMGPFELADQIGVDVILDVLEHLHDVLGDAYEPSPLLLEQVEAGDVGKKSGAGFYDYDGDGADYQAEAADESVARRLAAVMANEAAKLVGGDVADADTIDEAVELGGGFPTGPVALADDYGVDTLGTVLETALTLSGHARYVPAAYLRERAAVGTFRDGGDFETIAIEHPTERVVHIVIDRPDRLNTINPTVLEELDAAIDRVEESDARALVISGRGDRAFSGGAQVDKIVDTDATQVEMIETARMGQRVFGRLESTTLPVVAAIDGHCLGGGMELATCADIRIASASSRFGQPEHDLGLLPGWGGTQRLQWLIGASRAKEVIFTAEIFDAEAMVEYGFVNELVDDTAAIDRAVELADMIAAKAPIAQAFTKTAMDLGRHDVEAGLELETQAFGALTSTDDVIEGMAAFEDDRDPEFRGQ
ncbi:3-hydroxyacyl-CoA dehydrogenase/enoyl-CoA hydratase family protein [Halosolutus halophilus]|uniref:3-hydroxyacyl-CoA dehydrogenase/enoyl-CoA hydratase family protein n=1 Tax=Halosolutus halophilus TaxID=1552990 RepID=UPI002235184D|nr:3-hydroxyacyl-CoA dehydrogenase NAD-binding domain-containing protein [Halosolutus halophilus]